MFHNTVLRPGGVETASHLNPNCITRNNVFDVRRALATRLVAGAPEAKRGTAEGDSA